MPSNQTKNYQLSQWVKTDKVLMDDFNDDNSKIDAALAKKAEQSELNSLNTTVNNKANQSALDALKQTVTSHTATLSGKGNCRVWTHSYTGTGDFGEGKSSELTFPAKPVVVFIGERALDGTTLIVFYGHTSAYTGTKAPVYNAVTWSGNTMT